MWYNNDFFPSVIFTRMLFFTEFVNIDYFMYLKQLSIFGERLSFVIEPYVGRHFAIYIVCSGLILGLSGVSYIGFLIGWYIFKNMVYSLCCMLVQLLSYPCVLLVFSVYWFLAGLLMGRKYYNYLWGLENYFMLCFPDKVVSMYNLMDDVVSKPYNIYLSFGIAVVGGMCVYWSVSGAAEYVLSFF